jgi:hypothetical protein
MAGLSMRAWIQFEVFLLVPILLLNLFVCWQTADYAHETFIARQTPASHGKVYLDTCDGRPTSVQGDANSGCLADYPGEFARNVIYGGSLFLFVMGNLIYLIFRLLRFKRGAAPTSPREDIA